MSPSSPRQQTVGSLQTGTQHGQTMRKVMPTPYVRKPPLVKMFLGPNSSNVSGPI